MRAPRLLAAGTATASMLLLAGCEQPTPIVSVVRGGDFEYAEASWWCFEGQDPESDECFTEDAPAPVIRVQPGEQVGVDVSKEVSDAAWQVALLPQGVDPAQAQEQAQSGPVQDGHYFAFTPQFNGPAPLELQVRSLASSEEGAPVTGIWRFVLAPR